MLPRFELAVAAGGREALLRGPAALAPEPGREQLVGEVSQAAEAFGVRPGMRLGEALARCPRLALVPPDPVGVADDRGRVLAAPEAGRAGPRAGPPRGRGLPARGGRGARPRPPPRSGRPTPGSPRARGKWETPRPPLSPPPIGYHPPGPRGQKGGRSRSGAGRYAEEATKSWAEVPSETNPRPSSTAPM